MESVAQLFNERERIHLNMILLNSVLMVFGLFSSVVLPSGIIATLCLAIAALVISIGEWKTRLGLLPKFKSFPAPAQERHRYRSSPSKFTR
jgi:hypothetical protein